MQSRPAFAALALVALLLGGLAGGLLGSLLAQPAPAPAIAPASSGASAPLDPALARAIQELAREVRLLGSSSAAAAPEPGRTPVGGEPAESHDSGDLIAALDRLTRALQASQSRASPGGIGITPLILPAGGKRLDALATLARRDWEVNSREHRFWTYQQVLDRYGPPDEVTGDGKWLYTLALAEGERSLTFVFVDGYVANVYD